MDTYEIESILNFVLLAAVIGLFLQIKYYFSIKSINVHHRLQYRDIIYSIAMALLLYIAISNKTVPLVSRYVIFFLSLGAYVGTCVVMMNAVKWRKNFSRSFLIFHQGKFIKHIIHQNKLSEKDIIATLKLKGINNLTDIDSIILEANGELSVHFKSNVGTTNQSFDF
jgi:uncharacterized membrane protein YcaP (DUF421 family)